MPTLQGPRAETLGLAHKLLTECGSVRGPEPQGGVSLGGRPATRGKSSDCKQHAEAHGFLHSPFSDVF